MFRSGGLFILLFTSGVLSAQVSSVDFATEIYPIFNEAGCLGCHGGNGGFTIGSTASIAYSNLVNPSSLGNCQKTYIVAGDPARSFFYEKISGTPSCGSRMPRNNQSYFDNNPDKLETIRVWIEEGALSEASPVAVDEYSSAIPNVFSLEQNYPNPFNPATVLAYHLPEAAYVILTIYDVLGQKVMNMDNGWRSAGSYQVVWDGTNQQGVPVGTGVYFYSLWAGSYSAMKKMILLR
jgi:hypothetical protein